MTTGVIIVAGGSGERMHSLLPKQFLPLAGREILVRTVERFAQALPKSPIVVVLPEEHIELWEMLSQRYGIDRMHKVCKGGATRFHSVRNGLAALPACDYIAIHDGVRPLVSVEMIRRTVAFAHRFEIAVPVVELTDSIRMISNEGVQSLDRSLLRAVQTPQIFNSKILLNAYRARYSKLFTDDSTVVEASGFEPVFCQGERSNIKITEPADMELAEAIIARQNMEESDEQ